ncbi:MAG: hypothetical protein OEU36_18495 [Gammaproteobacteria bacterium]|nr:hypothetical protein [Gammaproteobacteria bacterium]
MMPAIIARPVRLSTLEVPIAVQACFATGRSAQLISSFGTITLAGSARTAAEMLSMIDHYS